MNLWNNNELSKHMTSRPEWAIFVTCFSDIAADSFSSLLVNTSEPQQILERTEVTIWCDSDRNKEDFSKLQQQFYMHYSIAFIDYFRQQSHWEFGTPGGAADWIGVMTFRVSAEDFCIKQLYWQK